MGVITGTLDKLSGPGGDDRSKLKANEIGLNDFSHLAYFDEDKILFCQYESATMPAKFLSKFTRKNKNTWACILFEAKLAIYSSHMINNPP